MIAFFLFALLWDRAPGWGFKDGVLHNSIWLGNCLLMFTSKFVHRRAIYLPGFHMCAAGWLEKGRVGYPIVKPGSNCGFGKTGIVDYGFRLNRSEKWDAYCYNPNGKDCGGVFTDSKHIFKTPGYPNEYEDDQICYWHIRVKYGQRINIQFLDFDLEDDESCMADYLEIYDSYDDVSGFVGRYCGDELPDDIVSTGNVMTLKFLSDASITAGGFQIQYTAFDPPKKNATRDNTNYLAGRFGII
uniref:TNF alpha induced protein 6 n=1 Tax=Anolis carolinensis TaxID=28377 RepID=H9G7X4_ANOCA